MKLKALLLAAMLSFAPALSLATQATVEMPEAEPSPQFSFSEFLDQYLNPALQALLSCSIGTTAPDDAGQPVTGQCWIDNSGSPLLYKIYDSASWVTAYSIDATGHVVSIDASKLGSGTVPNARLDSDLQVLAGITYAANTQSLLAAANYAAWRALLDLEAGTDFLTPAAIAAAYQPLHANLTCVAGLTSAADKLLYYTGSGTCAFGDLSTFSRTVLDDTSASAWRSTLGLVINTDVQGYDADLLTLATAFTSASAAGPAALTFAEDTDNGSNKVALKAPAALGSDPDVILPGASGTLATLAGTETLTGKTIDGDDNTVQDLGVGAIKAATLVTESETIASNDSDTQIPTTAAVKDLVDGAVASGVSDGDKGDITVSGSGTNWNIDAGVVGDTEIAAGVSAAKIGGGNVSSTEFDRLDGVSSGIQTQIDGKQPLDAELTLMAGYTDPNADRIIFWDESAGSGGTFVSLTLPPNAAISGTAIRLYETWCIAISDETTAITTGTAKASWSFPYAWTVVGVYGTLNTVSSSGTPTFDINEAGTTIISTKIVIDQSEFTGGSSGYQGTAAGAAVISDSSIAAFAQMTVDIDTAGTGAKGAKVCLIGYP